ncbi:MAG: hypothetical protein ABIN13_02475, partial [Mucilaginibacter sp.]
NMKRIFLILSIVALFFACTKEKQMTANPPVSELIGTWTIFSSKNVTTGTLGTTTLDVNSDEYPCLSNNVIEFKQDNTFAANYIGKDSCWVTPPPVPPGVIRTGTMIGVVGQATENGTWHQDGTKVSLGYQHESGLITKVDSKTRLTTIDTLYLPSGATLINTTVRVKK